MDNLENEIELIEKIAIDKSKIEQTEKEIKDKISNRVIEESSILFEDFETKLSKNLGFIYSLFSGLTNNEEEYYVEGKLPCAQHDLTCTYNCSNKILKIMLYDRRSWEKGLGNLDIKMSPRYKGIINKKIVGYNYGSNIHFNGPYVIFTPQSKNLIELGEKMEVHYRQSLSYILYTEGKKNQRLLEYENLVGVLKNLSAYIGPLFDNKIKEKEKLLRSL